MKVIEKAFRRAALKCHPDKGGDPVVFKKINDAYNKLIGHVQKVVILKLVHMSVHPKLIIFCVCVLFFFQDESNKRMSDSVTVLQDNRKIIPKMSMTYILQISNIFKNLCLLWKNFC